ncbi:MAG: cobalt-precorrin-5B (C1)-methyltransferase [Clostridia bacterium]|nr:cobalt-precorrin-5B (C1)-methyltransferase [Clostridia bacterium]
MSGPLVMVTGGARSGKSRLAEKLAAAGGRQVVYLATARVGDAEMAARVAGHRQRRPADWQTVEAPLAVAAALAREGQAGVTVLLDSLGMWLSNLLGQEISGDAPDWERCRAAIEVIMTRARELVAIARQVPARVIIVTEEAGLGLIPSYPLGRVFRDLLGLANQELARQADQVYLAVAGLPVILKDTSGDKAAVPSASGTGQTIVWRPDAPGRELRRGYTTGTCAAAAARAAALTLWQGREVREVTLTLPRGEVVTLPVKVQRGLDWAEAVVIKDAGDDPDVTNGVSIHVRACRRGEGLRLLGGTGIGRVTRPGLAVPPGEAAINPVPRQMITAAVADVTPPGAGMELEISIPGGEELARRTLNPRLGIAGGLSILGTTGIVEPMSEEAYRTSLVPQIDVALASGQQGLVLTPGRLGQRQAEERYHLPAGAVVLTSNFIGYMLEACAARGVKKVLLWGHGGKMIKVAGGIFYTHSRLADARQEILAAWAAAQGAPQGAIRLLLEANTVEAAQGIIRDYGLGREFWDSLAARASQRAMALVHGNLTVGTALLNLQGDIIGWDGTARQMLEGWAHGS